MSGIVHPAGCRCPGCLPAQYVMRPTSPPRPYQARSRRPASRRQPARKNSSGPTGFAILFGAIAGWFLLSWPAYAWHGEGGPVGTAWRWNIDTTIACSIWWGLLLAAVLAIGVATGKLRPEWSAKTPAVTPPAPPVCVHRNAVRVESALDTTVTLAQWCPDCETQLAADWASPPPAVSAPAQAAAPGAGWGWRWWCTCGKNRNGWSATPDTAKATCLREVASHDRPGHHYEYRWTAIR